MDNRIVSIDIVDGELIVTFQDGSTQSLGPVGEMDLEQLTAAVVKNAGDIVGLKRAVSALQTGVGAAETAIEGLQDDTDSLENEIGALKNDLSEFPNGNYPQMGAGYANQLVSGLKKADQTPYNFRAVPYDATLEEVKKIVGGTIVNNQLCNNAQSITYNAGEQVDTSVCTFDAVSGHKYLVSVKQDVTLTSVTRNTFILHWADNTNYYENPNENANLQAGKRSAIATCPATGTTRFSVWAHTPNADVTYSDFQITDLTQDFGTAIADYVYSLEQATAGAGVAWLKTHFPKQFDAGYQAYDAGTLKSIEGLSGKKTVGFNQWDEEYELGLYATADGEPYPSTSSIRSKSTNYIPIVSGATYYFNTSGKIMEVYQYGADKKYISKINVVNDTITFAENVHYIRFDIGASYGTTYNHDICINLSDPTKNGTYEPYEAHSYALDSDVVLRGIPKLDSNNQLYYDGDEYLPDGTINRRYGVMDLGTLDWYYTETRGMFYAGIPNPKAASKNVVCTKYTVGNTATTDKTMEIGQPGWFVSSVMIKNSSYTDTAAFKTAMSGVYLVYELATPTTETADPYTTPQIIALDGTEEYIYEDGAFELPVGHSSEYPVNVSGQLDDILDTPPANGTYTLKATVTDGAVTYSWVADA